MRLKRMVLWAALISSIAVASAGATTADALVWKFNGNVLVGTETIVGVGSPGTLTVPGAAVTCANVALVSEITNSSGKAVGEVTEAPFYECTTAAKGCTVESIEAARLPWAMHATTVVSVTQTSPYLVYEGVKIEIKFSGPVCALSGTNVVLKGTMGGRFHASTLELDKASYEATKTGLGAEKAELDGTFPLEAFGSHIGETLELG
jgi:hypothetical protein